MKKLTLPIVREALQAIRKTIESKVEKEIHVSGAKSHLGKLFSISKDGEIFCVNLSFVTVDQRTALQIENELVKWVKEHPLFTTFEIDLRRRLISKPSE